MLPTFMEERYSAQPQYPVKYNLITTYLLKKDTYYLYSTRNLLHGRCGVVVKTPARESEDPGFVSRLTVNRKSRRLMR